MPDSLQQLIHDTLVYFKDPLLPRQTIFAAQEDCALFQKGLPTPSSQLLSENIALHPTENKIELKNLSKIDQVLIKTPSSQQPPPVKMQDLVPTQAPLPSLHVQPPAKGDSSDFLEIKKALLRIAPTIKLAEEVPDDTGARRIANAWKEKITDAQVILLACETDANTLEFLKNLGKAIDTKLAQVKILPAERLERENRWDLFLQKNQFRLIIASDGMQKLPELMRFYKAVPAQSQYYLDQTPLLPLSSASSYKSLELKALLWKTLCHILRK
jgi:hypothetical protein